MSEQQRWAVLRAEAGNGWLVVRPSEVCREADGLLGCWGFDSRQHTWEEAMQEADRMARTVTVTLPANPGIEITARTERHSGWSSLHPRFYLAADADADLENIALALLAHARGNTAGVQEAWRE